MRKVNLLGRNFTKLEVVGTAPNVGGKVAWLCLCDCGTSVVIKATHLVSGNTKSCGCYQREVSRTHGMCKHPLYRIYEGMKQRCTNTNRGEYLEYGGRGIKICDRWLEAFENFRDDMSQDWKMGLELDRRDNDGHYSPENCRWATRKQNSFNRRGDKGSSSVYKGVSFSKKADKWVASITKDGKTKHLGVFPDEVSAATAYNTAAIEFFGEYAYVNNLGGVTKC